MARQKTYQVYNARYQAFQEWIYQVLDRYDIYYYGVRSNQDPIEDTAVIRTQYSVKRKGVYMGLSVYRGFWLLWLPVIVASIHVPIVLLLIGCKCSRGSGTQGCQRWTSLFLDTSLPYMQDNASGSSHRKAARGGLTKHIQMVRTQVTSPPITPNDPIPYRVLKKTQLLIPVNNTL